MTEYLRVYREDLAEVSRFYTVQHIQVILRLVYKIAKEQPYVLENYEQLRPSTPSWRRSPPT